MPDAKTILAETPFGVTRDAKRALLTEGLKALTLHHQNHCVPYAKMLQAMQVDMDSVGRLEDIPFIPVRLFKMLELSSLAPVDVFKTMTSSGTSGQAVSKIFLDKETAAAQQRTLVRIVSDFTKSARMPMLIIDSPSVIKDRKMFSARGAGILGFSIFGADRTYALNEDMSLNLSAIEQFLDKHRGKDILLFGFTFMVWQYFYKALTALDVAKRPDLSKGMLIHGGGWKKLQNEAVSSSDYKAALLEVSGIAQVHDYYGMVEQTGCIYMECEHGHLHASTYSDVIMRRPIDFSVCEFGETGLIQLVSLLPKSYPGHSILSEDEGVLLGEDDCPCGRSGKYFRVFGRVKSAEIRGCADTYEHA